MSQEEGEAVPGPSAASPHLSVVLFYKYFVQDGANDYSLFRQHASHYVPLLVKQISVTELVKTAFLSANKSSQPHLLGLPVVAPNS